MPRLIIPIRPLPSSPSWRQCARCLLAAGLSVCLVVLTHTTANAQKSKDKSKGGAAAPPMPMPGMAGPGGMVGPGGMAGPNAKKEINKRKAKLRDKSATDEVDVDSLPEGYRVPPEPPEALTTSEEWIFDPADGDDDKARDKARRPMIAKYKTIFQAGLFTGDGDKKLVADVIRYKLAQMTLNKNRDKVQEFRSQLLRDISQSPTSKTGPRDVRKFMLKTIAEEAPKLFKYHAIARINGAILLAELADFNEVEADGPRKPAEPCLKGYAPLKDLVNDKQQLAAVRIWGINGLVRIAMVTDNKTQRGEIVDTLVKLLTESANEHEWYQWRLVEGLGRLNLVQNSEKRPVVPVELARVLADEKRSWLVRAEAAQSLGRLPYSGADNVDVSMIAHLTAELTQQMSEAYNKNPKRALWKVCFIKVYGAFKPLDDDQKRGLMTQVEKGALTAHKSAVTEAFKLVLPIVRSVVTESEGIDTSLANLKKWLEANPLKSAQVVPGEAPVIKPGQNGDQRPVGAPPAADNAGR